METLYLIFINQDGLTPRLYAITDDKKIKNSFFDQRKNSMFTCRKEKVTKEEKNIFTINHSGLILRNRGFITARELGGYSEYVHLVVTEHEDMHTYEVGDEEVMFEIAKFTDPISEFFKEEYIKALNELFYFHIMKFVRSDDSFLDGIDQRSMYYDNFEADKLSVFIRLYGHTLKENI